MKLGIVGLERMGSNIAERLNGAGHSVKMIHNGIDYGLMETF